MKITATKKTIVILCIVLLFVITGSFAYLLYRDVIENGLKHDRWFVIDKYEEFFQYCEERKEGQIYKVICNGLVYPPENNELENSKTCFNILLIQSEEKNKAPRLFNLCGDEKDIFWEDQEEFDGEKLTPVKLTMIYTSSDLGHYKYNKSEIRNATDSELYNEFYRNEEFTRYLRLPIKSNYTHPEQYHNYIILDKYGVLIEETGEVILLEAELTEKKIDGEDIELSFASRIQEKEVKLSARTKGLLLRKKDKEESEIISLSEFDKLLLNKEYEIRLAYIAESKTDLQKRVEHICLQEEEAPIFDVLCINKDIFLKESTTTVDGENIVKSLEQYSGTKIVLTNVFISGMSEL